MNLSGFYKDNRLKLTQAQGFDGHVYSVSVKQYFVKDLTKCDQPFWDEKGL